MIDIATNTPVGHIPIEQVGSIFAVHPSGRRVYVNAQDGVAEIDALSNTVTRVIHAGIDPAGVAISPAGDRLYVVDYARDGDVKVIDTDSASVLATVPLSNGNYPYAIALSPDGQTAYVTNTRDFTEHFPCSTYPPGDCPALSIIDAVQNRESGRLQAGIFPAAVAFAPSGIVLVAQRAPDSMTQSLYAQLEIFDPKTFIRSQVRLSSNTQPAGVAVCPSGNRALVSAGGVSVVDVALAQEVTFISVGSGNLDGIAFNPLGTRAYAVDISNHALAIIDTTTLSAISTIPLGGEAHASGQFVGPDLSPTPTSQTGTPVPDTPTPPREPTPSPTQCGLPCLPTPTATEAPMVCLGDCNGNGAVTIGEVVTMVNIALGKPATCSAGGHGDGAVTVADLVAVVNHALRGCGRG